MTVKATLCSVLDGDRILLQKKSAGKFGEGKWNGAGGKLKPGETPREGAAREVHEETGLKVFNLKLHGVLRHDFGKGSEPDWIVYIFSTVDFEGEFRESNEGILRWFAFDEIPYDDMWQDDEHWLPLLLEGKRFNGEFYFNEDGSKLLDYNLIPHS